MCDKSEHLGMLLSAVISCCCFSIHRGGLREIIYITESRQLLHQSEFLTEFSKWKAGFLERIYLCVHASKCWFILPCWVVSSVLVNRAAPIFMAEDGWSRFFESVPVYRTTRHHGVKETPTNHDLKSRTTLFVVIGCYIKLLRLTKSRMSLQKR